MFEKNVGLNRVKVNQETSMQVCRMESSAQVDVGQLSEISKTFNLVSHIDGIKFFLISS